MNWSRSTGVGISRAVSAGNDAERIGARRRDQRGDALLDGRTHGRGLGRSSIEFSLDLAQNAVGELASDLLLDQLGVHRLEFGAPRGSRRRWGGGRGPMRRGIRALDRSRGEHAAHELGDVVEFGRTRGDRGRGRLDRIDGPTRCATLGRAHRGGLGLADGRLDLDRVRVGALVFGGRSDGRALLGHRGWRRGDGMHAHGVDHHGRRLDARWAEQRRALVVVGVTRSDGSFDETLELLGDDTPDDLLGGLLDRVLHGLGPTHHRGRHAHRARRTHGWFGNQHEALRGREDRRGRGGRRGLHRLKLPRTESKALGGAQRRLLVDGGGGAFGRFALEANHHRLREPARLLTLGLHVDRLRGDRDGGRRALRRGCGACRGRHRAVRSRRSADPCGFRAAARCSRRGGGARLLHGLRRLPRGQFVGARRRDLDHGATAEAEEPTTVEGAGVQNHGVGPEVLLHEGQRLGHRPRLIGLHLGSLDHGQPSWLHAASRRLRRSLHRADARTSCSRGAAARSSAA
ncbi:MAG: hypothetical protein ACO3QC_03475 [Phycisphaerales bacterium]